jgi:hypothetical protein
MSSERLRKIQALAHDPSTTPAERAAARAAAERLQARDRSRVLLADPDLDPPGQPPDRIDLAIVVRKWRDGEWCDERVAAWAWGHVDRLLLPDLPPDDPQGIDVEVLLQLSTQHCGVLRAEHDADALLRLLESPRDAARSALMAWFSHLQTQGPRLLR